MQNFDPDKLRADLDALADEVAALRGVGSLSEFETRVSSIEEKLNHALAVLVKVEPLLIPLAQQLSNEIAGVGAVEAAGVVPGETVGTHTAEHPPADPHGD